MELAGVLDSSSSSSSRITIKDLMITLFNSNTTEMKEAEISHINKICRSMRMKVEVTVNFQVQAMMMMTILMKMAKMMMKFQMEAVTLTHQHLLINRRHHLDTTGEEHLFEYEK